MLSQHFYNNIQSIKAKCSENNIIGLDLWYRKLKTSKESFLLAKHFFVHWVLQMIKPSIWNKNHVFDFKTLIINHLTFPLIVWDKFEKVIWNIECERNWFLLSEVFQATSFCLTWESKLVFPSNWVNENFDLNLDHCPINFCLSCWPSVGDDSLSTCNSSCKHKSNLSVLLFIEIKLLWRLA